MKFEQLLQVYWTKGFLYGGDVEPFNTTIKKLFKTFFGTGLRSQNTFIRRFECDSIYWDPTKTFLDIPENQLKAMNMYFSRITSVNHSLQEIFRYTIIRLYLIKSFRGRCQAIGKPSRGQRTWSNASNAFNCNNVLREFIAEIRKLKEKNKKPVVINYRRLKRKLAVAATKIRNKILKKKTNLWF